MTNVGQQDLETAYDWYSDREIDRFIAALGPAEVSALLETKRQECREKHAALSEELIDRFARHEMRHELQKRVPLMTLEEFKTTREQPTTLFPQPVPEPLTADAAPPEPVADTPVAEEAVIDQFPPTGATDSPPTSVERGLPVQSAPESATNPAISEPAIDLVSEPHTEPGSESIGPGLL